MCIGSLFAGWTMHRTGKYKAINLIFGILPVASSRSYFYAKTWGSYKVVQHRADRVWERSGVSDGVDRVVGALVGYYVSNSLQWRLEWRLDSCLEGSDKRQALRLPRVPLPSRYRAASPYSRSRR
ncbi:hypothetical protein OG21DRAFT_750300 [Imleria badia]|nr:hypothetical protein OG21DRAFT_750300 [Imleria badia]